MNSAIRLSGPVKVGSSTSPFFPRTYNTWVCLTVYTDITLSNISGSSLRDSSLNFAKFKGVFPKWVPGVVPFIIMKNKKKEASVWSPTVLFQKDFHKKRARDSIALPSPFPFF